MSLVLIALWAGISEAGRGVHSPWPFLPPENDWRCILKSFDDQQQIGPYVAHYMKPFQQ